MNIFSITALNKLWQSFLPKNENIYYLNLWDEFDHDSNSNQDINNIAASNGWLDLLKWAAEKYPNNKYRLSCTTIAISNNHIDIIKWLYHSKFINDSLINYAAFCGHLQIVKWFWHYFGPDCNILICENAATNGDIKIIKWLRRKGCPWNHSTSETAAFYGHLELLEWLYINKCPLRLQIILNIAFMRLHDHIIKWVQDSNPQLNF